MRGFQRDQEVILYLGTHKMLALLCEVSEEPRLIRYVVQYHPEGFKDGLVTNLERATYSIESLLQSLCGGGGERLSKDHLGSAYVVLGNPRLKVFSFSSSQYFHGFRKTISSHDVRSVIEQTRSVATLPLSEFILQTIPASFVVNDLEDVSDPIGLEAQRLGAHLKIFTMAFHDFKNISRAFESAEVEVKGYYPRMLTAPCTVLNEEEKQEGVLVIDIGNEATFLTLWGKGELFCGKVLEVGSRYLSLRVAEAWKIDFSDAEKVKDRYGTLEMSPEFGEELIPLVVRDDRENRQVYRKLFQEKFAEHAGDWLETIIQESNHFVRSNGVYNPRCVFTGGGTSLNGFLEFVNQRFSIDARIGFARGMDAPHEAKVNASLTSALGMLNWLTQEGNEKALLCRPRGFLQKTMAGARDWFTAYF